MNLIEVWRPVQEFPGYEVSSLGQVRSYRSRNGRGKGFSGPPRILKPYPVKEGYLTVNLCVAGARTKKTLVHRLVLAAFRGKAPKGFHACHFDGIRTNNRLDNLRWDTAKNNAGDKVRHGTTTRGERNYKAKLTNSEVMLIVADKRPHRAIAADYGIARNTVGDIKRGKSWKHLTKIKHHSG